MRAQPASILLLLEGSGKRVGACAGLGHAFSIRAGAPSEPLDATKLHVLGARDPVKAGRGVAYAAYQQLPFTDGVVAVCGGLAFLNSPSSQAVLASVPAY